MPKIQTAASPRLRMRRIGRVRSTQCKVRWLLVNFLGYGWVNDKVKYCQLQLPLASTCASAVRLQRLQVSMNALILAPKRVISMSLLTVQAATEDSRILAPIWLPHLCIYTALGPISRGFIPHASSSFNYLLIERPKGSMPFARCL
jgi:hypothetical protein